MRLSALDALIAAAAHDRDLASPPDAPSEGDCYVPAEGASGAWTGWEGDLAVFQDGAWRRIGAPEGAIVFIADEARLINKRREAWSEAAAALGATTQRQRRHGQSPQRQIRRGIVFP